MSLPFLSVFDVLFAVFLALIPQEEKRRERENHSPSTVGKANDLSQPLLSPRLAARKLPAVPHILVTDYIIFQKHQHVIRIREKNITMVAHVRDCSS